jgi:hypothetical protein
VNGAWVCDISEKEKSADRIKMLTESNETFLLNPAFIIGV